MEKEEYLREQQKLQKTRTLIEQEIKASERRLEEGFEDYDFDDYSDDAMKAALVGRYQQRIRNLTAVKERPYFARVDFVEQGTTKRDAFYFGKTFITDHESLEQVVVDWRAPVADLYYEGRLGPAEYHCPEGDIRGEIALKRQYFFNDDGTMQQIMDIDITTNDEMLQPFLSANSDTRLKNIVATIQAEQNKIIRATMWKPLVVQGVAGSGKTTIALHRIAYLIYHCGQNFYPEEFLIIAPNKFFLNYISNVLPDLGVERVQQRTYEEIAFEVIGREFEIEDPNEKLSQLIDNHKTPKQEKECEIMEAASMFKSTLRFKNIMDEYLYEVEKRFLPQEDFSVIGYVFMTKEEIAKLFYREYAYLPYCRRIEEIKKHMYNQITKHQSERIEEIEKDAKYQITKVKFQAEIEEIQRAQIRAIYEERDQKVNAITKQAHKQVNDYFKANKVLEPLQYYKEFIDRYLKELTHNRIPEEQIKAIQTAFHASQRKGKIEMEDIAPLMYLKYRIHGIRTKFELKHIVIDEAQDFSEFQFYIFKKIVKSNSLTILGDLAQGIYYYRGTRNWQKTMELVFEGESELEYLTLQKTYRTTEEIMNAANHVISQIEDKMKCPLGEPVMKQGNPVTIRQFASEEAMLAQIRYRIQDFESKQLRNIAIIGKTAEECIALQKAIGREDVHRITDKDSEYQGGISVVPSYLSKGLEFDAVIIAHADEEHYTHSEVDTKLLYVCMTRAMNTLDVYSVEEITSLLKDYPTKKDPTKQLAS